MLNQTEADEYLEKALNARLKLIGILDKIAIRQYAIGCTEFSMTNACNFSVHQIKRLKFWAEKAGQKAISDLYSIKSNTGS